MSVFGDYSRYYNLLYQDKDYAKETEFICQLLQEYAPNGHSILELGCGTGKHARLLAEGGYTVHGVDRSATMLEQAQEGLRALPNEIASRLSFSQGDLRRFRLGRQFDIVISLFHVVSYQTGNDDLQQAFATAQNHLKPGGPFLFDAWYGPAVLSDPPVIRVKRLEDNEIQVTRIAEPEMFPNENVVNVNYQVFVKDKRSERIAELTETHRMRYLFAPEVEELFRQTSLQQLERGEWITRNTPDCTTWPVYWIARKTV